MPQNFYEIATCIVPVKSMVEILQNFVAFSEYMNFTSYGSVKTILSFLPKLPTLDVMSFAL